MITENTLTLWSVQEKRGINVPIVPGIKPFSKLSQLSVIPKTFNVDLPQELVVEAMKCKDDKEARALGIEWCINQCRGADSIWGSGDTFFIQWVRWIM